MPYLLPNNATRFERAVSQTTERVDQIPVPLRTLWTPEDVPAAIIPFLAWAYSIDLWSPDWSEERKRDVIRRAIELHRLKGTETGIAEHLKLVDTRLLRAVTPPATTFLMPAFSAEERERFLALMPQLRVYPFVHRGVERFGHFTTKAFGRSRAFVGASYVHDTHSFGRYRREARLWDRGEETILTTRAITNETVETFFASEYDEVILPAKASAAIFPGAFNAERRVRKPCLAASLSVTERFIRIPRTVEYTFKLGRETYTTAKPGLDFINVEPRKIAESHSSVSGAIFAGKLGKRFLGDRSGHKLAFLPPSRAWQFIFELWHLHDPDRVTEQRKRMIHLNRTFLGIPPYTARLTIEVRGHARKREVWQYIRGFLRSNDFKQLTRARDAVNSSKSKRDKILLNTKTMRPPRPGDRVKVGTLTIGQFIAD